MKTSLGEKVFWTVVALSSIGAGTYGYQRFKQIRPDLYGQPQVMGVSEAERAARIAEYRQKGDALTRAATPSSPTIRAPKADETCANGVLVEIAHDGSKTEPKAVLEGGKPVRCTTSTSPTIH